MRAIAIFVKNLTSGGAEKQSVLLARALAGKFDVHYVIFNGKNIHPKYLTLLDRDSRIRVSILKGCYLKRFYDLRCYLKENKVKYLFSYLTAANLYACLVGEIIGADVYVGLRNTKLPWPKQIVDRFLTNHLAVKAIANSYSGKINFVSNGFSDSRVVVIPNCFENISPYREKRANKILHIITVGRFVTQKDYKTAIRAVAELTKRSCEFAFDIVGYGGLESQIRSWVYEYGISEITNIHINPNNISELLDSADIYMSTSLYEGTSNSIMEAMNANLPIVATDVGDNAHLVKEGWNGMLNMVGDFLNISNNLYKLLCDSNTRHIMGRNSKMLLYSHFTMDTFRENYIKLIDNKI